MTCGYSLADQSNSPWIYPVIIQPSTPSNLRSNLSLNVPSNTPSNTLCHILPENLQRPRTPLGTLNGQIDTPSIQPNMRSSQQLISEESSPGLTFPNSRPVANSQHNCVLAETAAARTQLCRELATQRLFGNVNPEELQKERFDKAMAALKADTATEEWQQYSQFKRIQQFNDQRQAWEDTIVESQTMIGSQCTPLL